MSYRWSLRSGPSHVSTPGSQARSRNQRGWIIPSVGPNGGSRSNPKSLGLAPITGAGAPP